MSAGNDRPFIDHLQNKERKEQAMKCPLISIGYLTSNRVDATEKCVCGKEECGRWDDARNCCIDITIGDALEGIMIAIQQIQNKMPHAGQFTQ